jgi:hypothetical protein
VANSTNVIKTVALWLGKQRCIGARVCTMLAQNDATSTNARHVADIGPDILTFTATRTSASASTSSG